MNSPYDSGDNHSSTASDAGSDITPNHLCFIIHGMGGLQQIRVEQLIRTYKSVLNSDFSNADNLEVEFIPIDWHSILHNLDSLKRLGPCGLPTVPILRRINNEILSDVLYYFTKFHGQSIVNHATETFNSKYEKFMEKNPEFSGKIAIFAHSLGGIISYDILRHQDPTLQENKQTDIIYPQLKFKPDFLFNMGVPLSAVIVMRGLNIEDYLLPSWCRNFNIFHIMDPLGYRLEPLFCETYADTPPVAILRPSSKRSLVSSFYSDLKTNFSLPEFSTDFLNAFPSFDVSKMTDSFSNSILDMAQRLGFAKPTPSHKRKHIDQDDSESEEPVHKKMRVQESSSLFRFPDIFGFSKITKANENEPISPDPIERRVELNHRHDFMITENVLPNVLHEYFVGMNAHFQYWLHKDCVYAVLKVLSDGGESLSIK